MFLFFIIIYFELSHELCFDSLLQIRSCHIQITYTDSKKAAIHSHPIPQVNLGNYSLCASIAFYNCKKHNFIRRNKITLYSISLNLYSAILAFEVFIISDIGENTSPGCYMAAGKMFQLSLLVFRHFDGTSRNKEVTITINAYRNC